MGSIVAVLARKMAFGTAPAQQMLAAAPHRGSDFTVYDCGSCVLGVSNKSDFVDSTISKQGQVMAAFSGKLDNAVDLRKLLIQAGYPPASADAADVVVSAFKAFGPEAPSRMRGVFAAIITDGRQMWWFRDHLGLKPLYYRDDPNAFFVASEAKQIIAGAGLRREPNLDAIERILFGKKSEEIPCALQGAYHVRQATTYIASIDRAVQRHRYWHPEKFLETARLTSAEVAEQFAKIFGHAVARSLTGEDVISLSGGIDSPAIAAFAAPHYRDLKGRALSALSAVFPDLPKVDESQYIQLIADDLGMDLHTYRIQAGVLDDVQHWCNLLDGPVPTIVVPEIYENYEIARRLGFRNVLTGELAEYVFGFRAHVIGHLLTHGRWKPLWRLITTEIRRGRSRRTIGQELLVPFIPGRIANWYLRVRGRDHRKWIPDWINHRRVKEAPYRPDLFPGGRSRWSEQQLLAFKGSTLLDEADELCADLNGITVRRPFADIDLWEFFLSLRAEVKFPDLRLKTLIRGLLRGKLPDAILQRRDKTVFNDHLMSQVDYPLLRQFLVKPNHPIDGIDYQRLAARIEHKQLSLFDWMWASNLVRIHAFLNLW